MATGKEIQQQLQTLNGQLDDFRNASITGEGQYVVNGRAYSQAELDQAVAVLNGQITQLRKSGAPFFTALDAFNNAGAALKRAKEVAASPITESPTGMSQAQANAEVAKAQKAYDAAQKKYNTASAKNYATTRAATPGQGLTRAESEAAGRGRMGAAGGFGATAAPAKGKGKGEQPATGGGPAGGGVGGGGGGVVDGGKIPPARLPKNWEATFRKMFPTQSWLLDVDRTQYPQLYKHLQKAVKYRSWESDTGATRWVEELKNTDFYRDLANKDAVRTVKSLVGDLGFDTVPFNKFLTNAMNLGWQGDTLKSEVYKEAFRKNDDGTYANPTAQARASKSTDYLKVANIGKAYFNQIPNQTIENRLSGVITDEDVNRQQRELAKAKYGHLANLIDQGLTLDEIASPFRQQAADLLEKTPDQVDMSQADFEAAYNYGEPGKKRMMTSGEWEIMLRSDAKYGWQNTNNAKAEARQLASSITQAFGRVI